MQIRGQRSVKPSKEKQGVFTACGTLPRQTLVEKGLPRRDKAARGAGPRRRQRAVVGVPPLGLALRARALHPRAVEARHDGREGGEPLVVQLVLEEKHPALQLDAPALGERLVGRSRSEQVALRSALGRGGRGMVCGGFAWGVCGLVLNMQGVGIRVVYDYTIQSL